MQRLIVRHRTRYRYPGPVALGPHRLLLRPREGRGVRLLSFELAISPAAAIRWSDDVHGNSVATVDFHGPADRLEIDSRAVVELDAEPWPIFAIDPDAMAYPFLYSDSDWAALGMLATPPADPDGGLRRWAQGFVAATPTDTLSLLKDINAGLSAAVAYVPRDEEGTQLPALTLQRREGSCRDFATLFIAAVRSLGFGARAVSGYLHGTANGDSAVLGTGSTHGWAEVYLPGAGWIAFDPTNATMGGHDLVPVAVAADIADILPVIGSFAGDGPGAMTIDVEVEVDGTAPRPADQFSTAASNSW